MLNVSGAEGRVAQETEDKMMGKRRDAHALAIAKMREIVDQAVDCGADAVTIEFAKEGGLEVLFMFGNTGVGGILVDRTLGREVMTLIHVRARLGMKCSGLRRWESRGRRLKIRVDEYDSFGESARTLTFPKKPQ